MRLTQRREPRGWDTDSSPPGFIPADACEHVACGAAPCTVCVDDILWILGEGRYAPNQDPGFVTLTANAEDVEVAKEHRSVRDRAFGKNFYLESDHSDDRWVGDLAEALVMRWLLREGVKAELVTEDVGRSPDLRVSAPSADILVEVKCSVRNVPPLLSYSSGIPAHHAKPASPSIAILFASYEVGKSRMTIIGSVTMGAFTQRASLYRKGERVNQHFTAHYDLLNLANEDLTPPKMWVRSLL